MFVLSLCTPLGVHAQSNTPAPAPIAPVDAPIAQIDALVAVSDAEPLELARVAARLGDEPVLSRLDAKKPIETQLAAIRATPYLRAPEAALASLVPLIGQRDGVLAQDAARSLWMIMRALDVDALQRREASVVELSALVTALDKVLAIETLRADLRSMASASAAMLSTLIQGLSGAGA